MESNGNKLNFAENLKASNIAVSFVSLNEYSKQILLLLSKIVNGQDNDTAPRALDSCKETIKNTIDAASSIDVLNEYIKFGGGIPFLLREADKSNSNIRLFKQIAICYLDIAKILNDDRVNKLSFAFADELIYNDHQRETTDGEQNR